MRILFLDPINDPYDTRTPLERPLGGTQSAVIYLAVELARQGHDVGLINGGTEEFEQEGLRFLPMPCAIPEINTYDVVVVVTSAVGATLKEVGVAAPLILWCHHAPDQPAVQPLAQPDQRSVYAGFAMVSKWQAAAYHRAFDIPLEAMGILRNAVAPCFLETTPSQRWLKTGEPPVLAYTSTPFRGLDALLLSFPSIRKALPGATLRVFSGFSIYGADKPDEFTALYEMARTLPGVEYVGPVPQPELARAMAEVDIWSYPCVFPETSCIAAMEAMASGSALVTTAMGALPETTMGFANIVNWGDLTEHNVGSTGMIATSYANVMADFTSMFLEKREMVLNTLDKQVQVARAHFNRPNRAREWAGWLETFI